MVKAEHEDELPQALAKWFRAKSFGDDKVLVEKYIERGRHIEVQIAADNYGNVIHLGERMYTRDVTKRLLKRLLPLIDSELREEICGKAFLDESD